MQENFGCCCSCCCCCTHLAVACQQRRGMAHRSHSAGVKNSSKIAPHSRTLGCCYWRLGCCVRAVLARLLIWNCSRTAALCVCVWLRTTEAARQMLFVNMGFYCSRTVYVAAARRLLYVRRESDLITKPTDNRYMHTYRHTYSFM